MIRYTCANCNKELMCLKNNIPVVHFMDNDKAKGIDSMRYGDLWGCTCGCRVVLGMGGQRLGMDIPERETEFILKEYIEVKR